MLRAGGGVNEISVSHQCARFLPEDRHQIPSNLSDSPEIRSDPSIFDRCHEFFAPDGDYSVVKRLGLYPYFRALERNEGSKAIINGREIIMAGSNNYLGLTSDPRVVKAAKDAIEQYGTGCTGS